MEREKRLAVAFPGQFNRRYFAQFRSAGRDCRLPEILAVDDDDLDLIEVEIVEQARIHADFWIVEIRLAGRPVRRFGEGAAAAGGAETMFYRFRAPLIERDILERAGELELRRNVIGPQRAAFRAEGAGALRQG